MELSEKETNMKESIQETYTLVCLKKTDKN